MRETCMCLLGRVGIGVVLLLLLICDLFIINISVLELENILETLHVPARDATQVKNVVHVWV